MEKIENSCILIVNDIEECLSSLLPSYSKHSIRIIKNEEKDEFLLAQATSALKEAYISSNDAKYIFLCGKTFRNEAQNSLLKVLEEPPSNIVFIIVTTSKSSILPTIFSRIPHKYLKVNSVKEESDIDIKNIDLKDIYNYLRENQRVSKNDAKKIVQEILFKVHSQNIKLTEKELDFFAKAVKLIDLNSKPVNVLTTLLLTLLDRENR